MLNGSGVVQPPGGGAGGGGGRTMPGGSQPPLAHVPPPRIAKGSGVAHAPAAGGGGAGGGGGGMIIGGGMIMPGGSQPPLTHVPPPRITNGSGVAQPTGCCPRASAGDVEVRSRMLMRNGLTWFILATPRVSWASYSSRGDAIASRPCQNLTVQGRRSTWGICWLFLSFACSQSRRLFVRRQRGPAAV